MSDKPESEKDDDPGQEGQEPESGLSGLMVHLVELRARLLRSIAAVLVVFIALSPFANKLYEWLAGPLMSQLPHGDSMIAIDVASPFIVPIKLVFLVAVVITVPYLLYQAWAFVAPGLYRHEKRLALPLLLSSIVLFYTGMAFAYFIVFPMMFRFFTHASPAGVKIMTDIGAYLGFVTNMFLAFGAAFEVPVAVVLFTAMGVMTPEKLVKARPYVIVGAFVVAMLITPPDVLSQVSLAIPLIVLYEAGVLASRLVWRRRKARETQEDEALDEEAMERELDKAAAEEERLRSKDRSE